MGYMVEINEHLGNEKRYIQKRSKYMLTRFTHKAKVYRSEAKAKEALNNYKSRFWYAHEVETNIVEVSI